MDPAMENKYSPFIKTDIKLIYGKIPSIYKDKKKNYVFSPDYNSKILSIDEIAKALLEINYQRLDRGDLYRYSHNIEFINFQYDESKKNISSSITNKVKEILSPRKNLNSRMEEVHGYISNLSPAPRKLKIEELLKLSSEKKCDVALKILNLIMSQDNIALSDLKIENITFYRERTQIYPNQVNFKILNDSNKSTREVVDPSEIKKQVGLILSRFYTGEKYKINEKEDPNPQTADSILSYIISSLTHDDPIKRISLATAKYILENREKQS